MLMADDHESGDYVEEEIVSVFSVAADGDVLEMEDVDEEDDNEEEEEEDEGESEEENEKGEYTLRSKGEINLLDFTEDDTFEVEPDQLFEHLEYEALAERKRKAIRERQSDGSAKKVRQDDAFITNIEEIMEGMNFGRRRKLRKTKKRGRRKGSRNKLSPEVTRKLGEANVYYAKRQYEEAIRVLKEVVMLAPNLSETYHTLGLIYEETGDKKKAINFFMLAAHLAPKDHPSIWKGLVALSLEQGNVGQATYCLSKAIKADPDDMGLRQHQALLYTELGDYQKAAESYQHIIRLCPENTEARKMAAKMYHRCNQFDNSVSILEEFINDHASTVDLTVVCLLVAILLENNAYATALKHIERARSVSFSEEEFPLYLNVKAGICNVHLGNIEEAEVLFRELSMVHSEDIDLVIEVADTFMSLGHVELSLKYYFMLEGRGEHNKGPVHLKIAQCYLSLKDRTHAIEFFYKALQTMEDNIDARLNLASLLLEEERADDAITLLSPPKHIGSASDKHSEQSRPWWLNGKLKKQLAQIYYDKGRVEEFVDAIFSSVRETLFVESYNQKVKSRKRLSRSTLFERVKLLDNNQADNIFRGFKPIAAPSDWLKASRAKKLLQRKAAVQEEKKAAMLAAGMDWHSDESDDDSPRPAIRDPPLPNLLKDNEHYQLVLNLCKALASLRQYWEALEIINHFLRLAYNSLSLDKREELRSLGAQLAYNTTDPANGYDYARYIVQQHPYSFAAWNCYYKVISRLENKSSKHSKFLLNMRSTYKDCVPAMIISGHQFTMLSQHQAAAREYLEAYKLQPDNPLINLCAGTALINLALGLRLRNRNLCVVQGLAFLFNNLRLCEKENKQEALYNIARALHHVGLVTLAVAFYEKVLAINVKDYPVPKLPNEDATHPKNLKPGYCSLHREAAYNLHLIYKASGALDLARQVLKDHCSL